MARIFRKVYLLPLGIIACGCATPGYNASQYTSTNVRNQQMGIQVNCDFAPIANGDRFPLKLDTGTVQLLNTLPFRSANRDTITAFRNRFQSSGDYPIVSFTVTQTYDFDHDNDIQAYGTSTMLQEYATDTEMIALIFNGDGSNDLEMELSATSNCSAQYKSVVGEWNTSEQNRATNEMYHRAFTKAANDLLQQLEANRAQIDDLHAEFLFSN